VIRDILHRLADRFPCHVLVWPVRVQGETCHIEVSAAIHGFNTLIVGGPVPRPDLIIVARGGGSLEDLWGFNEEAVARAVAASTIPLISAVGHETDWTIIDLVADFRAPTPTAAAERAVPVRAELIIKVTGFGLRAITRLRRVLETQASLLAAIARGLPRRSDILALPRQRFDAAASGLPRALKANAHAHRVALTRSAERLRPHLVRGLARGAREQLISLDRTRARALGSLVARKRERLDGRGALLASLGHHNVLARGFALVRDAEGAMVRRAAEVSPGMRLDIEFADGHVGARADGGEERKTAPRRKGSGGSENQGTLL
jgi:exodeoxyribonuclease VII large subunit